MKAEDRGARATHVASRTRMRWRVAALLAAVVFLVLAEPTAHAAPSVSVSAPPAPGLPWRWPVPDEREVVAEFRAPAHEYGAGHRGMDIAASPAAVVLSPAPGVVAFRGTVVDRPLITIDHGSGFVTTLEPVQSTLSPGTVLAAGAPVGVIGSGGHAAAGSLHVGVRRDGRYVNPLSLFGAPERAVLLPCCAN